MYPSGGNLEIYLDLRMGAWDCIVWTKAAMLGRKREDLASKAT